MDVQNPGSHTALRDASPLALTGTPDANGRGGVAFVDVTGRHM
jgi:hypothetical protein